MVTREIRAKRPWLVLGGVSLMSFLGCLDLTIVNTAAPAIGRDLSATVTEMQIAVNAFVVALSMFMVTAGRLSDRYGRRRVLFAGAALFALASLGAGLAPGVAVLVVFRFLQGVACAVLYTSSSAIVADAFPDKQRGRAIGTLFAVNGLGLASGPLFGGLVVAAAGWRWVFLVNVPLVALALVICGLSVAARPPEPDARRQDRAGVALLTVALFGVVFALTFGDVYGWLSWRILTSGIVGLLALASFVVVDRRHAAPLVPFRLFSVPLFRAAVITEFCLAFFYTTALFLMPLYLFVVRGLGDVEVGLLMLAATATVAVLSPLVGRVVERIGPLPVMAAGFVAFAGSAVLQAAHDGNTGLVMVCVAFALLGAGWAMTLGPSAVAALSAVPSGQSGLAVGASWTFHNFGGAVGLALGMTVFRRYSGQSQDVRADDLRPDAFTTGHTAVMLLLAVVSLGAVTALLTIRARAPRG
nr:MFS transporter [Kibdelosporangium sp. MJ126-NF4]